MKYKITCPDDIEAIPNRLLEVFNRDYKEWKEVNRRYGLRECVFNWREPKSNRQTKFNMTIISRTNINPKLLSK